MHSSPYSFEQSNFIQLVTYIEFKHFSLALSFSRCNEVYSQLKNKLYGSRDVQETGSIPTCVLHGVVHTFFICTPNAFTIRNWTSKKLSSFSLWSFSIFTDVCHLYEWYLYRAQSNVCEICIVAAAVYDAN